jgi:hypothetical protein
VAKRDDRKSHREPTRQHSDLDKDQKSDTERQKQDPEHERAHNELGNQAISSMMGGMLDAELAIGGAFQAPTTSETRELFFGGEVPPVDDGDLTLEDLTRDWAAASKRKSEDRLRFFEPMPDDEVPEPSPEFLASLTEVPIPAIHLVSTSDRLLQPSMTAVRLALPRWSCEGARFVGGSLGWRATAHALRSAPAALQDRHGRVSPTRARTAAWTSLALLETAIEPHDDAACALVSALMELQARAPMIAEVILGAEGAEAQLPLAEDIVREQLDSEPGAAPAHVPPRQIVFDAVARAVDIQDALPVVPDLESVTPEPVDDPLGLEAVMAAYTVGPANADDTLGEVAVATAERLAILVARSRVHVAGAIIAVDSVLADDGGSARPALVTAARVMDNATSECLDLLVEVARAAKTRVVPLRGIRNGLRRSARSLDQARNAAIGAIARSVERVVGGDTEIIPPPSIADQLAEAWADGEPRRALAWLHTQEATPDRDLAIALTAASSGADAATVAPLFLAVVANTSATTPLGCVARSASAAALLSMGAIDEATTHANVLILIARARANPMLLADGALTLIECQHMRGNTTTARSTQRRLAAEVRSMGGHAALAMIAAWEPAPDAQTG